MLEELKKHQDTINYFRQKRDRLYTHYQEALERALDADSISPLYLDYQEADINAELAEAALVDFVMGYGFEESE